MDIWYKGYLEHPKKCSGMHFWDPQTTLTIRFLSRKKFFFSKFWGPQIPKNFFLACGIQNRFLGKILTEDMTAESNVWAL